MGFFLLVFVISLADYFVLLNKHYYYISTKDEGGVDEWLDFCHIQCGQVLIPSCGEGAVLLNQREFHTGFDFCGCQHVFGR